MFRHAILFVALVPGFATAQPILPAPDGDRTNPNYVPWQIDETGIDAVTFDQRRAGDPRITDFEFVPALQDTANGFPTNSYDPNLYYTIEIENTGQYANSEIVRVGPGVPSVVVQALRDQNLRPIDMEMRPEYFDSFFNSAVPARMMVTAVPNGTNPIEWDILLDRTPNEVDSLSLTQNPSLRPVDIEYSGQVQRGLFEFRGYAVLAVENEPGGQLGEFDWDIKWNVTDFAIAAFQTEQIGRLVDFEIHQLRYATGGEPRYDAILYDWQGQPRYSQLANLPGQLGDLFDSQTDFFEPGLIAGYTELIPAFTAGFRPIDVEYTWAETGFTSLETWANAAVVDAPTGLQKRVREALDAEAVNTARNSNEYSGLDIKQIGGERLHGIHPGLWVGGNKLIGGKDSPPAFFPFLAAYAYLFDDIALTEQQLDTCTPTACPVPAGVCNPQLFTVEQLVNRVLDLGDYSAAATLVEERYTLPNVTAWIDSHLGPFGSPSDPEAFTVSTNLCHSQFRLSQISDFVELIADGTLATGQLQTDILSTLFDDSASLRAQIGAVIDTQAAETDLTPSQIEQFKQAVVVRHRTLSRDAMYLNVTPTLRVLSMNLLSVPVCGSGGVVVTQDFAITAFVETDQLDPSAPDAAVAAALTDAIANALDGWEDCTSEPCLADVNNDGMLSPTDFTAWIGAYNASAPECDQNGDGMCTPTDFSAWIGNYNAGC